MHLIIIVVVGLVGIGLGYGFRGLIHREISKADLTAFASRLESAVTADVATVKTLVANVAADIRKRL
jgi:predicted transporter